MRPNLRYALLIAIALIIAASALRACRSYASAGPLGPHGIKCELLAAAAEPKGGKPGDAPGE